MKLYFTILLAFCLSGCYSQLQYTESLNGSDKPSEDPPLIKSNKVYADDLENWYFYYFPYYKDYASERYLLPEFNRTYYPGLSFYSILTSESTRDNASQSVDNSYFSNPILVCWNPPIYPASSYQPNNIPINIGVGIINGSRIKKSGDSNHGPRAIGPNRVSGSSVLPDRTRGTNIRNRSADVIKMGASAARSTGSSTRNRSRGN